MSKSQPASTSLLHRKLINVHMNYGFCIFAKLLFMIVSFMLMDKFPVTIVTLLIPSKTFLAPVPKVSCRCLGKAINY